MDCISKRVAALAVSQTLAMSQRSQELRAAGVDVINLSVGEPDFDTPAHIKEAAKKAIDDNFTRYTPVPGYMTLRQAIADKLSRENGLHAFARCGKPRRSGEAIHRELRQIAR